MVNLENILSEVVALSKEVGAFIRQEALIFQLAHVEQKGLNDLVSYVDKEAEKKLVAQLAKILPEAGFIVEEGTLDTKGEVFDWIVDPLDGTTNFIHGLPVFAVSIGLVKNGEPVLGVVYEINKDECFYAMEGGKAYLNGKEISVSTASTLGESLIATGFPFREFENVDQYLKVLKIFMEKTHGVRRLGSAAVDLVYVACGRYQGFFESNLKPWDVAAGVIIIKQAGGTVTDYSGGNDYIFGKGMIAANQVHPEILKVVRGFYND